MKTGQEPTSPERGGGVLEGGDTGQSGSATAGPASTAALGQRGTRWVGAAGFLAIKHSTLLGI